MAEPLRSLIVSLRGPSRPGELGRARALGKSYRWFKHSYVQYEPELNNLEFRSIPLFITGGKTEL